MAIRTVHVVFKTHLDLGFTDSAAEVVRTYREDFIPAAIRLAHQLADRPGPARFVWTTGAWLIAQGLDQPDDRARAEIDAAIRAGHIAWHALPFTTHTEMLDAGMARHALTVAGRLDARYGRRTIAAKLTDVPGHTVGLVPHLASAGVRFLHIGTNPTSATPDVPETFVWRAPDGSEVVVSYASTYGATTPRAIEIPGCEEALHVSMTTDNHGPPPADQVESLFADLAEQYPGTEIRAGRLDDFAAAVWPRRAALPVVTDEIGDTWIHGLASDPVLVARYRALQRWRADQVAAHRLVPGEETHDRFADELLRVPEHTWGMDQKTFLPDYVSWSKPAFAAARARDTVTVAAVPPELTALAPAPGGGPWSYRRIEGSWQEQRAHLDRAVAQLPDDLRSAARAVAAAVDQPLEPEAVGDALAVGLSHVVAGWSVTVGEDGALVGLTSPTGQPVADTDHPLGRYAYTVYDADDYDRWFATYHESLDTEWHWALPDFGKPGMAAAGVVHAVHRPRVVALHRATWAAGPADGRSAGDGVVVDLEMPPAATEEAGAPRELRLTYRFDAAGVEVQLFWSGKDAHRLPEASWISFGPMVLDDAAARWTLDKLGTEVDPARVVPRGNRALHAVGRGAVRRSAEQVCELVTRDAPLVAVERPRLLDFDDVLPDPHGPVHVLLHDNVWGTNFPLWSDDDAVFGFRLTWT